MIEKLPSFLDYLGYMYYCGGTIAGPFFEYKDYINFIRCEGNYKMIPSTIIPTLKRVSHAICNLFHILSLINSFYNNDSTFGEIFTPEYLLTEEYAS